MVKKLLLGAGTAPREHDMTEPFTCSICGRYWTRDGNNAQPVNDGQCCDQCNWVVVLPARMQETDFMSEIKQLRKALAEIHRRTALLLHHNTGRWDQNVEHSARTIEVLRVNQDIATEALMRETMNK
jgi:hypothetical protein